MIDVSQEVINAQTSAALTQLQREIELHNTTFRDFLTEMKQEFIQVRIAHDQTKEDHENRLRVLEARISQAVGAIGILTLALSIVLHFWK